jgi:serine/threonine protein kinase
MLRAGLMSQTDFSQTEPAGAQNASLPPPKPEEIAPLFPHLEILECLGRGGMGVVYKARQPNLNRLVALKILAREKEKDPRFAERFVREAQALARLNHPNIVTVHDFGETDGLCYLVMEFVDGLSLRQMLRAGTVRPEEALAIVPRICEALQYAHEQGIVHRDIKPENILLDKAGRVKIADFGIAKMLGNEVASASGAPPSNGPDRLKPGQPTLTEEGRSIGTPHYMAPEQVEHPQKVDHRADIYSLGVVFYEMLTGELPLGKFAPPSSRMHGVQVDVRLDEVVLRALEKEPERRYQQAGALKTEVETIAGAAFQKTKPNQRSKPIMKKPTFWLGAGVGAAIAIGLAVWMSRPHGDPARLSQEGWHLWQTGKLNEAADKFRQSVKLDPRNANSWNGLGWATFNAGKAQEAEPAFQKAIALEPNHPAALNGLGQIYLFQKKYAEAEKYLLQAAPKAPAAWFGLARLYLLQGKFEDAQTWAQKIVDSGQGDEFAAKMLQAAKDKRLSDGLRLAIEPQ